MEWSDLTEGAVRGICNEKSYGRGRSYYRGGHVVSIGLNGDRVKSAVDGTYRYKVSVSLGRGKGIGYHCTCPYDWGGACKHVVATLLYTMERGEEMIRTARNAQAEIDAMLKESTTSYMKQFLAGALAKDPSMARRFGKGMNWRPPEGTDYRAKIDALFNRAAGTANEYEDEEDEYEEDEYEEDGEYEDEYEEDGEYGKAVDLDSVMSAAKQFEKAGNHGEAARIYGELADAVATKSKSGYRRGMYDDTIREAIAKMGECSARVKGAPKESGGRIRDMFDRSRGGGDARFRSDYEAALWSACKSADNMRILLAAVEPHVPKDEPAAGIGGRGGGEEGEDGGRRPEGDGAKKKMSASERRAAKEGRKMLAVKAIALERTGRRNAAEKMLAEHGAAGPDTYALYVSHLARAGQPRNAARMSWEGIYRFGDDGELTAAALDALKKSRRERCALSEWLYVRAHDPSHLARLKKESGSWAAARARIIGELEKDKKHPEHLLDLLVGEGMHKRALRSVVALGDIALLGHYRAQLAPKFPKAYVVAYWHGIERMADGSRSAPAYRRVAGHLADMARVPSGGRAKARELARMLCERHSNRPLLVRTVRGIRL